MKLTMRIENVDYLPDGGPLDFSVSGRGFEAGRDSAMDWTLPDPTRHISSRHFVVDFRAGQYWLTDVSSNGTCLYGQPMRLSGPHALTHNDRIQVGQYIIRVLIEAAAQPFAAPAWGEPAAAPPPAADPWSVAAPLAVPKPLPMPNRPATPLAGQYGDSFIDTPPPAPGFGAAPAAPPPPPMPRQPGFAAAPIAMPAAEPFAPVPPPSPAPAPSRAGQDGALLDAICRGAGLPPGSLSATDTARLGEDIGRCLAIATKELMALLGARAAAKQFVKSSSRTMIGGMNNSPLKFKPNPTEAMMTMFVQRPESYQDATTAFQQGFDDIKRHQTAAYAAMQPALARLLEDLSPESIEEKTTGGLMSSKKSRAWETYVARWDAKTHPYENGMLDVFLAYFSDAYDDAVKKTGG
jgi:type VI secretion system protein ImpI